MRTTEYINNEVGQYFSLVEWIVRRDYSNSQHLIEFDDMVSIGLEGLLIGIKSFNEETAKTTHYTKNIKFKISSVLRDEIEKRQRREEANFSTTCLLDNSGSRCLDYEAVEMEILSDQLKKDLSAKQVQIIDYLLKGCTHQEIASLFGVSRQAITKEIKKIRGLLKMRLPLE